MIGGRGRLGVVSLAASLALLFGALVPGVQVLAPPVAGATAPADVCASPPALTTGQFVTCWDTEFSDWNSSDEYSISLPLVPGGSYDFTVDWGDPSDGVDDSVTSWDDADSTHTYATPGRYWVTITGTISGFSFGMTTVRDAVKLMDVHQWGPLALGAGHSFFQGARNMKQYDKPQLCLLGRLVLQLTARSVGCLHRHEYGLRLYCSVGFQSASR